MAPTRSQAAAAFKHVVENIMEIDGTPMLRVIKSLGINSVEQLATFRQGELETLKDPSPPEGEDGSLLRSHIVIVKQFQAYYIDCGNAGIERTTDLFLALTPDDFWDFTSTFQGGDHLEDAAFPYSNSRSTAAGTSASGNSRIMTPAETFRRGIKRDISIFPELKDEENGEQSKDRSTMVEPTVVLTGAGSNNDQVSDERQASVESVEDPTVQNFGEPQHDPIFSLAAELEPFTGTEPMEEYIFSDQEPFAGDDVYETAVVVTPERTDIHQVPSRFQDKETYEQTNVEYVFSCDNEKGLVKGLSDFADGLSNGGMIDMTVHGVLAMVWRKPVGEPPPLQRRNTALQGPVFKALPSHPQPLALSDGTQRSFPASLDGEMWQSIDTEPPLRFDGDESCNFILRVGVEAHDVLESSNDETLVYASLRYVSVPAINAFAAGLQYSVTRKFFWIGNGCVSCASIVKSSGALAVPVSLRDREASLYVFDIRRGKDTIEVSDDADFNVFAIRYDRETRFKNHRSGSSRFLTSTSALLDGLVATKEESETVSDTSVDMSQAGVRRSTRTVRSPQRLITEIEAQSMDLQLTPSEKEYHMLRQQESELTMVGLGSGFSHTSELHTMMYREAMTSEHREDVAAAVKEEHEKMGRHNMFKAMPRSEMPPGTIPIDTIWAIKKASGKWRTRLNIRGLKQVNDVHYDSSNLMASMQGDLADVVGAFLNGQCLNNEQIYVEVPEGFEQYYPADSVLIMLRAVYGTKQAALCFWVCLWKAFKSDDMRFQRNMIDPCLYFKWIKNKLYFCVSWGDDLLMAAHDRTMLGGFKSGDPTAYVFDIRRDKDIIIMCVLLRRCSKHGLRASKLRCGMGTNILISNVCHDESTMQRVTLSIRVCNSMAETERRVRSPNSRGTVLFGVRITRTTWTMAPASWEETQVSPIDDAVLTVSGRIGDATCVYFLCLIYRPSLLAVPYDRGASTCVFDIRRDKHASHILDRKEPNISAVDVRAGQVYKPHSDESRRCKSCLITNTKRSLKDILYNSCCDGSCWLEMHRLSMSYDRSYLTDIRGPRLLRNGERNIRRDRLFRNGERNIRRDRLLRNGEIAIQESQAGLWIRDPRKSKYTRPLLTQIESVVPSCLWSVYGERKEMGLVLVDSISLQNFEETEPAEILTRFPNHLRDVWSNRIQLGRKGSDKISTGFWWKVIGSRFHMTTRHVNRSCVL